MKIREMHEMQRILVMNRIQMNSRKVIYKNKNRSSRDFQQFQRVKKSLIASVMALHAILQIRNRETIIIRFEGCVHDDWIGQTNEIWMNSVFGVITIVIVSLWKWAHASQIEFLVPAASRFTIVVMLLLSTDRFVSCFHANSDSDVQKSWKERHDSAGGALIRVFLLGGSRDSNLQNLPRPRSFHIMPLFSTEKMLESFFAIQLEPSSRSVWYPNYHFQRNSQAHSTLWF
jgi:hypothetical protein